MHLAELSSAARLFLVAIVGLGDLGDRFAIGNFGCEILDLHLVLVGETAFEDVEVVFALTLYDVLLEFLGVGHEDRRVFELALVEQFAQFFILARLDAAHGRTVSRFGEHHGFDLDLRARSGQSVVGAGALEFDGATDVAGRHFGHLGAVLSGDGEYLRYFLFVACARVREFGPFGEFASHDTEVVDLAHVALDLALEDEQYGLRSRVGYYFIALGILKRHGARRIGGDVDDELHDAFRADVLLCRAAEDGHHAAEGDTFAQARADVVLRESAFFEVELHEALIVLGGGLHELLIETGGLVGVLGGDVELFAGAVVVLEFIHLHHQYVDEGVESGPRVDWELHQHRLDVGSGADALDGCLPRCFFVVELVDYADERFAQCVGVTLLNFAAGLETVLRVEKHYTHIGYLEAREQASAEVVGAWDVDDIEFAVHELGVEDSGVDRALVLVLEIGVVGERVFALDTTPAIDNLTLKGHRFGKGSFSGAWRPDQDYVPNFFGFVIFHCVFLF